MSTIPKVTEKAIRNHVGERSFTLGERYVRDGTIFNARRQGRTLKARCQGSRAEAYRVEATFAAKGLAEAECSCPVGGGGHCKHVAALLLTWCHQPETFTELEELEPALKRRSKEDLIALIKLMLRQQPDLELLLETPLPGTSKRDTPVSPKAYRRQAEAIFHRGGHEWGAVSGIADELLALQEIGGGFLKQQDLGSAAAVYEGICSAVIANYSMVDDEEGDLHTVVHACVKGLSKCLKAAKDDPEQRQPILRTLFEVYCFDIEQGGSGMSDEVPDLAEVATPEERRLLAGWVREAMPRGGNWSREEYGGFLLDLEADTLDDETFLRVCRETGRKRDLVARLLQLGRQEEALEETKPASDYDLTQLADLFVAHRLGDTAERLVQERSQKSKDSRLLEWLKKRAAGRQDTEAVLELSEKLFCLHPSLSGYQELRKLAKKLRRWETLRPKLHAFLKKESHTSYVLIQIYLDEGDLDQALKAVKTERGYGYGSSMKLEVAKAAEKTRPREALEIYRKQAESHIAERHRGGYQQACPYLKKVQALYKQLGESEAWRRYVGRLREQHGSLRALQEELTKARL